MELEQLKNEWQKIEKKVAKSEKLNQTLVNTLLNTKSTSILDQMKARHTSLLIILGIEIIFFIAVLLGNPFDFKYKFQYLPFVLLIIIILIAAISLYKFSKAVATDMAKYSLKNTLENILEYYRKNETYDKYFGIISFSIGLLVPWSFLPNKIANTGWSESLLEIGVMTIITLLIYLIAFWLGAFKNKSREKLSNTLAEWNIMHKMMLSED
ncbi:MAG: hypothetical protein WBP08_15530 [Saprospiraceae bacterium]